MSAAPIGVFDSGVGGLTVVRAIEAALPGRPLVYLGDTARVPYGTRSPETVTRYALEAARFLAHHRVRTLVVACNTASSVAIEPLRAEAGVPVYGVIGPGARRAVRRSRGGAIGVIGTRATVASGAYEAAIHAIRPEARVVSLACPLFVPLAEEGWTDGEVARGVADRYLAGFASAGIDTLVLGCTHYPLLRGVIAAAVGDGVTLVDSAESVAEETRERDAAATDRAEGPPSAFSAEPPHRFFVTDDPRPFRRVAERFLGRPIARVERVRIDRD